MAGTGVRSRLMNGVSKTRLPILLWGAKELEIVHINIIRGAKEPRNLQNHRGVGRSCISGTSASTLYVEQPQGLQDFIKSAHNFWGVYGWDHTGGRHISKSDTSRCCACCIECPKSNLHSISFHTLPTGHEVGEVGHKRHP